MKRFFILACFYFLMTSLCHAEAVYKVGDRVASPAGYRDKWLQSVVVEVDQSNSYPYRIHPLGYLTTMDENMRATMLRPMGSVPTEPMGHILNDPWLMKIKGIKAFHPKTLYKGQYECWNGTEAVMLLNFQVLDNKHYRDSAGHVGEYHLDTNSLAVTFKGGALNGQPAVYEQASNPPISSQPPSVNLTNGGEVCQRSI